MNQFRVDTEVILTNPDNPYIDGQLATIVSLEEWGAHVVTKVGSGAYRALWEEMLLPVMASPAPCYTGYTGDVCDICGSSKMRRNGTCLLCDDCGTTSGCS